MSPTGNPSQLGPASAGWNVLPSTRVGALDVNAAPGEPPEALSCAHALA